MTTYGNSFAKDLTKREVFAMMALQGICSNPNLRANAYPAPLAVELADELIAVLNSRKEKK